MCANKILVLDDDITVCEAVRLVGESCGYSVNMILNPDEFNTQYTLNEPDIILLDLNLGQCDGIEVLRELSHIKSTTKIILISGYDEKVLHSALLLGRSRALNIIAALHKPINFNQLKGLLQENKTEDQSVSPDMIKRGIEQKEFLLYYQPKIFIKTAKFAGVEALIRWNLSKQTMIYPDAFIDIAEENELLLSLSSWANHEAVKQCAEFKKLGFDFTISINISAKSLCDLSLPDKFDHLIKRYGLMPKNFCIEMTELEAVKNVSTTLDILTRLRLKGFGVSIDDFGTGFSSLVELHRTPCSELKIDKSFVINLKEKTSEYIIVRSIIRLGHDLGLTIVAEGVETMGSFRLLKKLGCDIAQGYLIGHPMPSNELIKWIRTHFDDAMTYKFPIPKNKKM